MATLTATSIIAKGVAVTVTTKDGEQFAATTERRTTAIMDTVLVRIPGRFMPVGFPRGRVALVEDAA